MSADSRLFYHDLEPFTEFAQMADPQFFQSVPDDWMVVLTDVAGSTAAIEAGRHKDVNVAGVAAIIALRNRYQKFEFPFVFGGDGATFLLPASMCDEARDVLAATRNTCRALFDLKLRVGMVPVRDLRMAGHDIQVAKQKVSPMYWQAVLIGSGVDEAEKWVKDERLSAQYQLSEDFQPRLPASYVGVFCPFQDIRGAKEEIVSLIVKVKAVEPGAQQAVLDQLLSQLDKLLGQEGPYHPLAENIQIRWANAQQLQRLIRLTAQSDQVWKASLQRLAHQAFNTLTRIVGKSGLVSNADFRKYDGSLKMVVACSTKARQELQHWLDAAYQQGQLCYGLHVSDKALITCGLHLSSGQGPIHFIDGADGGYAFAARQLKQQLQMDS